MTDAAVRRARVAVAAVFFLDGVGVSSWVVRIPAVKERLGLTASLLGLALLGAAVGALIAMTPTGRVVGRLGSGRVTRLSAPLFALALVLPPLATNALLLGLALAAFGMANGALGVAMNAHAAAVERRYGRPIMSSFHALFSAGGLVGAALGGVAAGRGLTPAAHLAIVAAFVIVVAAVVTRGLLPPHADLVETPETGDAAPRPRSARLVALGVLAFFVLLMEGSMADWSALYLATVAGASEARAALGFAAFSVTMALGRAVGDALTIGLGAPRLVRAGGALAAGGIALALLVPVPSVGIVGFALVGAGLAAVFPSILAASSRLPGVAPGRGIATVSSIAWFGFVAGPPAIGFVADLTSLRGAMLLVGAAGAVVLVLAGALGASGSESSERAPMLPAPVQAADVAGG